MFSVHLCVHYTLYARNNKQLVWRTHVAQLDKEREWSYQVEHSSCGLYVQRMVYIVIESKCPSPLYDAHLWKDGSRSTTGASESLKPLQEAEELKQR